MVWFYGFGGGQLGAQDCYTRGGFPVVLDVCEVVVGGLDGEACVGEEGVEDRDGVCVVELQ